jgi:hypothetical protein
VYIRRRYLEARVLRHRSRLVLPVGRLDRCAAIVWRGRAFGDYVGPEESTFCRTTCLAGAGRYPISFRNQLERN